MLLFVKCKDWWDQTTVGIQTKTLLVILLKGGNSDNLPSAVRPAAFKAENRFFSKWTKIPVIYVLYVGLPKVFLIFFWLQEQFLRICICFSILMFVYFFGLASKQTQTLDNRFCALEHFQTLIENKIQVGPKEFFFSRCSEQEPLGNWRGENKAARTSSRQKWKKQWPLTVFAVYTQAWTSSLRACWELNQGDGVIQKQRGEKELKERHLWDSFSCAAWTGLMNHF